MTHERESLPVETPPFYAPREPGKIPAPLRKKKKKGLTLADIPRLAGYAFMLFLAWLLFSTLFKPWLSSGASRAIIDAPAILITSPIDGTVTAVHTESGDPIKPGQVVAEVQNGTVTHNTLSSLQTRRLKLQNNLQDLKSRIQSDKQTLAHVDKQYRLYHNANLAQVSSTRASMQAELQAAQAKAKAASTDYWRQVGLQRDGAASAASVSAARAKMEAAQAKADALKQSARSAGASVAAAAQGVYVSDAGSAGVLPKLAERRSDLKTQIQNEESQLKALQGQLGNLGQLVGKENKRVDTLSAYKVKADAAGTAQDVVAPVGTHVKAGATLVRATNCSKSGVVAVFDSHLASKLNKGSEIRVDIDGLDSPLRAHVVRLLPSATQRTQDGYSVPFPHAADGSVYALTRWDKATPKRLREQACTPGRSVQASLM